MPANKFGATSATPGSLTPILPASDLAVGKAQRFLLALLDGNNRLITDAAVDLSLYKVTGPNAAALRYQAQTTLFAYRGAVDGGIYVARVDLDEPGDWGVEARIVRNGQPAVTVQAAFVVRSQSATPSVGSPVPASHTATGTTAEAIERFSSARPVDLSLYRLSVADALKQRKPLVVLFASPGFCESRTCGPSLEVVQALHREIGDRANFIHVEIYKDAKPPDTSPAVAEWGLPSEPWLFLVGSDGLLREKFEGVITFDEIRPALAAIAGN